MPHARSRPSRTERPIHRTRLPDRTDTTILNHHRRKSWSVGPLCSAVDAEQCLGDTSVGQSAADGGVFADRGGCLCYDDGVLAAVTETVLYIATTEDTGNKAVKAPQPYAVSHRHICLRG